MCDGAQDFQDVSMRTLGCVLLVSIISSIVGMEPSTDKMTIMRTHWFVMQVNILSIFVTEPRTLKMVIMKTHGCVMQENIVSISVMEFRTVKMGMMKTYGCVLLVNDVSIFVMEPRKEDCRQVKKGSWREIKYQTFRNQVI